MHDTTNAAVSEKSVKASQLALPVPESVLSQIWFDGWLAPELRLTDGRRLSVVYRGVWTHSNGPDFSNAMLDIDGTLLRGSVELHLRASDWLAHGHDTDPVYDAVILHAVLVDDLNAPVSGPSRKPISTLELRYYLPGPLETFSHHLRTPHLGSLGARACLPNVSESQPELIREVLRRKGWERLAEKQLRFGQSLSVLPAAEALYRGLLDSLGLSHNRGGMAQVAERLPLALLERFAQRHGVEGALAALLGTAGFLPLTPAHAALIEWHGTPDPLEALFDGLRARYALEPLRPGIWNLNRVRPLNHPARRLASLASLVAQCRDGLLATFLELPINNGKSWHAWLEGARPAIGESRRFQIVINSLAPFLAAYADAIGNPELEEEATALWERLPGAVRDSIARRTRRQIAGDRRFPIRLAIEEQGLHQIGRFGCADLRCFECPIAALASQYEPPPASTPES